MHQIAASPRLNAKFLQRRKNLLKYLSPSLVEYGMRNYSKRLIKRLKKGELISKILKEKYFWSGRFISTNDTLDPRHETELIIELFVEYFKKLSVQKNRTYELLDACTGTGAIGISILEEVESIRCTFLDVSHKALQVCKKNIRLHKLWHKSKIYKSPLEKINKNIHYDFLVSNPPYLTEKEIQANHKILSQEPRIAFYGGEDGLYFYRLLAEYIRSNVKYFALIELDHNRSGEIYNIFHNAGFTPKIYNDMYGMSRVLYINCFNNLIRESC